MIPTPGPEMTRQARTLPRADGKCALPGCQNEHRENSIFCSDLCKHRQSKMYEKERRNWQPKKPQTHPNMDNGPKNVLVRDDACADPYWITTKSYNMYAADYQKLGIEVIIGNQEVML